MAKKKDSQDQQKVSNIDDKLSKEFGDGVFVSGNYITEKQHTVIPVSPAMDIMLNGGIPFGSFMICTGAPKTGKTLSSLDIAGTALQIPTEFDIPRHFYYLKVEGRLQPRDLLGIHHLKNHVENRITVVQSVPGKILYAEDYLDIAEQLVNEKPGSILIMDSFSQLCSKSRREKDWGDSKAFRDDVPTFLANFCKRISNVIPINQTLFIGVTHQIANTGFGFSSWAEASGTKVQYQLDVKLKATYTTTWKEGESKIGQETHWECFASPLQNGPVVEKAISRIRYGWGIDKHTELINICGDMGLITKGGAWYTIDDQKIQGIAGVRQYLLENPDVYTKLYNEYREMMDLPKVAEELICL